MLNGNQHTEELVNVPILIFSFSKKDPTLPLSALIAIALLVEGAEENTGTLQQPTARARQEQ
jgi:hypothetical protein